jgi:biofilm PGA synthesis N-glycosyltransferase PgaC
MLHLTHTNRVRAEESRCTPVALTVLVPAYNEEKSIADTIHSLQGQTVRPDEIIVIDDCSADDAARIARGLGVAVFRPPQNTGSKPGAQNFALPWVRTPLVMPIEDLFAFTFYKQIQNYYEKPLIASGCFSMYGTELPRAHGGWQTRTLAEDMDLTWSLFRSGQKVRFAPEAVCSPIEPHDYAFMRKQLKRWSHGFVQNVTLHCRGLFDVPAILVPVLVGAARRGEMRRALASVPAFLVLRTVNAVLFLRAAWSEWVMRKSFRIYEKGH